ncbi:MAG: carbohydrate ABC transporter permease [Lachnospiraceae bacterium]|nr:carbohydrate ABC transporter permease [Lachnospiraceae bacterium]
MDKKKIKLSKNDRIFHSVNTTILVVFFLIVAYPLYFVVIASFSDPTLVYQGKIGLLPKGITFLGYERTFSNENLFIGYKNTILYTVIGTILNIFMTMTAAYALSVRELYGRRVILFLITFTMYFGGGIIPKYFLMRDIHLINSFWVMVIPCAVNAYNLMIARSFLESNIPKELYEAAQIDGCGRLGFFRKVVMPLSSTLVAILVLFYGVGHWNSYFDALMYITEREKFPLQVILREILLSNQFSPDDMVDPETQSVMQQLANSMRYAIIIFSSLPVLILYPFLQKYFVKGMMIGSVKG